MALRRWCSDNTFGCSFVHLGSLEVLCIFLASLLVECLAFVFGPAIVNPSKCVVKPVCLIIYFKIYLAYMQMSHSCCFIKKISKSWPFCTKTTCFLVLQHPFPFILYVVFFLFSFQPKAPCCDKQVFLREAPDKQEAGRSPAGSPGVPGRWLPVRGQKLVVERSNYVIEGMLGVFFLFVDST